MEQKEAERFEEGADRSSKMLKKVQRVQEKIAIVQTLELLSLGYSTGDLAVPLRESA